MANVEDLHCWMDEVIDLPAYADPHLQQNFLRRPWTTTSFLFVNLQRPVDAIRNSGTFQHGDGCSPVMMLILSSSPCVPSDWGLQMSLIPFMCTRPGWFFRNINLYVRFFFDNVLVLVHFIVTLPFKVSAKDKRSPDVPKQEHMHGILSTRW